MDLIEKYDFGTRGLINYNSSLHASEGMQIHGPLFGCMAEQNE